ncbi:MAG TPA: class I SAM-dependent methyltransferase [Polyangiaceae bacterium]|nr:class I SAM-dependent methyltransferase [Polyangiaceae bacterium]
MIPPSQKKGQSLMTAMKNAQFLAFAPLLFQAARALRDRGFLRALSAQAPRGMTVPELMSATNTSRYGVVVLLEAGMAAGMVEKEGEVYRPTRTGLLIERDPLTRANMNFVQDVCYRAADHLDESIEQGRAAGLSELGDWPTVYDGLSQLGEPARQSWLDFDHFYSDDAFPLVMNQVFSSRPRRVLDVGGNTGKFATQVLQHDPEVRITVADLPGQIASCKASLEQAGLAARASFHPFTILDPAASLPADQDVIWMSQFLSCFSEDEVTHVLSVARRALRPDSRLLILDNFWDRQPNEVGEFCLQAISLYFTCVANGTSRMYDSSTVLDCIKKAGLVVESQTDQIGWGHTLIECRLPRA